MATALEGKNATLRAKKGSAYEMVGCASSLSFNCETELIAKTGPNSAAYREFAARYCEWGITLSGVSHIQNGSNYTVFELLLESLRREGLDMEFAFEDAEGNLKTITGHVLIPSITIDAPIVGFIDENVEFKGTGPFTIATELITPDETDTDVKDPINYTATGGEEEITFSELIGRTILTIERDGDGKEVIAAGAPNDKQVKFLPGSGTLVFPFALDAGEWVLILYK